MNVHSFSIISYWYNFSWLTSFLACSISSWAQLEERFHEHFYNGINKTKLSHLTLVMQAYDMSIVDFAKQFREINN
jgi:hypothetical protein